MPCNVRRNRHHPRFYFVKVALIRNTYLMSLDNPTIYVSPDHKTVCVDYGNQQHIRYKDAQYSDLYTKHKDGCVYKSKLFEATGTLSELSGVVDTSDWTVVTQAPF